MRNDTDNTGNSPEEKKPEKKKRLKLFELLAGYGTSASGVDKKDVIEGYGIKSFFKLYGRRFRQIVAVNWFYILGNFPLLFLLLALSGNFSHASTAPVSEAFPVIYGIMTAAGNSSVASAALMGIHGITGAVYANTTLTYILYGISALTVITFGLVNTGCSYLLRNIVRREPMFIWSDFFGAIKRNWKQSLIIGVLDIVMLSLCSYSLIQYWNNYNTMYIMFYCMIATFLIYMFLRCYMYTLLVTFEMSIPKMIRNSFIFSIMNLGKNLLAALAIGMIAVLLLYLSAVYIPIAIIIVLMLFFGTASFIGTYTAYAKIDEVMIEPYREKEKKKSLLDDDI